MKKQKQKRKAQKLCQNVWRVTDDPKVVELTVTRRNGAQLIAKFDASDFDEMQRAVWRIHGNSAKGIYLATGHSQDGSFSFAHIMLLGKQPKGLCVYYGNHDTLDLRRGNLIVGTYTERMQHVRYIRGGENGIRIKEQKRGIRYEANIYYHGKYNYLGRYETRQEALAARQAFLTAHSG